jgi:hypothetical protein
MMINGANVDETKLYTLESLIEHLKENGESDRALSVIREYYFKTFGNELIWYYPISNGYHAGVVIVVVKEGFAALPYNVIDKDEYEIFEFEHISLFNEDAIQCFIDDWKNFTDDLLSVLHEMMSITKGK